MTVFLNQRRHALCPRLGQITRLRIGNSVSGLTQRFKASEDGNVTMMISIGITVILAVAGAAIDYTMVASSNARSQHIADAVALNATVYVQTHDEISGRSNGGITPEEI